MRFRSLLAVVFALLFVVPSAAQSLVPTGTNGNPGPYSDAPKPYEIMGVSVEGVEGIEEKLFIQQTSGLAVGMQVTLPGDPAIAEAIRRIYRLGGFSDVKIVEERTVEEGLYLAILVTQPPQLGEITFTGVKKKHRDDLETKIPLLQGSRIRPSDLERSEQLIEEFYHEKGFLLVEVDTQQEELGEDRTNLVFNVDRGKKVKVSEIVVSGNDAFSGRRVRKQMKTNTKSWWRFWKKKTFDEERFEDDLDAIVQFYNDKGYYDARIVHDSAYVVRRGDEGDVVVEVGVHEGPQYHIRDIEWEGNTLYPDALLSASLGVSKGDVYNASAIDENLYANRRNSDINSLYLNRGYMRFSIQPTYRVVEGDSLDLHFDLIEGDIYEFGEVNISGNTKTKEHVIRRELLTVPGQTFSRDAIQETIRRLAQLNYFDQESLGAGPSININESRKAVDLGFNFEETGSDQLELSGTFGRFGLVLLLGFTFNNFSIQDVFKKESWRPLPSGDGQRLSLRLQTNGRFFQSYTLGYTEPWFRGRPTPVGFNFEHSRFSRDPTLRFTNTSTPSNQKFIRTSASVFYDQRLKWPDSFFNRSTGLGYQYFQNDNLLFTIPNGISQEITLRQGFSRNSLDHPVFPRTGSRMVFSASVALPIPDFIQYHKWRFQTDWNVQLRNKVSLSFGTDYGYIGSITGDPVEFERFVVGGSPFDSQGFSDSFGKDIIYMRGYPARVLGPRRDDQAVGGRILNKYTSELRWLVMQSAQLQAAPYLFMDAANTWDSFGTYSPTELFRSAGVGIRLFLPIVGMLELVYGYNFDEYEPLSSVRGTDDGTRSWRFQFTLGQSFGQ